MTTTAFLHPPHPASPCPSRRTSRSRTPTSPQHRRRLSCSSRNLTHRGWGRIRTIQWNRRAEHAGPTAPTWSGDADERCEPHRLARSRGRTWSWRRGRTTSAGGWAGRSGGCGGHNSVVGAQAGAVTVGSCRLQTRPGALGAWWCGHRTGLAQHLAAQRFGQEPDECGKDRPVGPVQARPGIRPAQDGDLVAQHEDLSVLGRVTASQQHQPVKDPDEHQVHEARGHN